MFFGLSAGWRFEASQRHHGSKHNPLYWASFPSFPKVAILGTSQETMRFEVHSAELLGHLCCGHLDGQFPFGGLFAGAYGTVVASPGTHTQHGFGEKELNRCRAADAIRQNVDIQLNLRPAYTGLSMAQTWNSTNIPQPTSDHRVLEFGQ